MITWVCEVCGKPIKNGTGYMFCPIEVYAVEDAWDRHDAEVRSAGPWGRPVLLAESLTLPRRVRWLAVHGTCDDGPAEPAYLIEIERIRTIPQLLDWTSHLMSKTFLGHTDWCAVLSRVAVDLNHGRPVDA